ncbi:MAG: class I SAM-dependent methyltransferase [Planctomycetaceae bacterium]|nr:class I SAM-dependent methyltransferase [Planctomycetaceae bacterium]
MLPRTLEPEVMDTAEEAADYDLMDHSEVNTRFVEDLLDWMLHKNERAGFALSGTFLDVGVGTAQIPIELATRTSTLRIQGIDLAQEMLQLARRNAVAAQVSERILLDRVDAKQTGYADAAFDGVISNSIVHHIPEPGFVFAELWRVLKPAGVFFVRDLLRPETNDQVEHFVATYTAGETPHQQQLFRQSLHAALTVDEIADLIAPLGLPRTAVQQTSDRHWTIAALKPA